MAEDYFGAFLNTVRSGVTSVAETMRQRLAASDPLNAMLLTLDAHGGAASIAELLEPPFVGVKAVAEALDALVSYGLVVKGADGFRLTDQGASAANKLKTLAARAAS